MEDGPHYGMFFFVAGHRLRSAVMNFYTGLATLSIIQITHLRQRYQSWFPEGLRHILASYIITKVMNIHVQATETYHP